MIQLYVGTSDDSVVRVEVTSVRGDVGRDHLLLFVSFLFFFLVCGLLSFIGVSFSFVNVKRQGIFII